MLLIQDNQAVSSQPKPLRITGLAEKVEQAKRAIELLLNNDENNRMGGGGGGNMMVKFWSFIIGGDAVGIRILLVSKSKKELGSF
jgi:hypothetical protein